MKKKLLLISVLLIAAVILYVNFSISSYKSPLTVEKVKGASGLSDYIIIYKNNAKIDFEITRPNKRDTSVLLCIAGAFTSLDKHGIDGLYICKGKTSNKDKVNHRLGGAIKLTDGECTLFPTAKGKLLTDSLIADVEMKKGSLFQQILMIENGKVETFKDTILFLRRGIVNFKNGETAIAESTMPVTLKTFASDVASLGAKELLYTDMGAWDEGWYRSPIKGSIALLGYDHSQTDRQSNWVVFRNK